MKIESSQVAMASSHMSYSETRTEKASINVIKSTEGMSAILELSEEGSLSYTKGIEKYQTENARKTKAAQEENQANAMRAILEEQAKTRAANGGQSQFDVNSEYDMKIKMLRAMLELLNHGKKGFTNLRELNCYINNRSIRLDNQSCDNLRNAQSGGTKLAVNAVGEERVLYSRSTVWQNITATDTYVNEFENTTFASTGKVVTADGRSLDFNVEVTLGRSLSQHYSEICASEYIVTDPLVINLDTNITSVSDQKFYFDLDSDGKEESISFAGKGSGFLAYDKNGDGIINDGSELFGTKSGDGFKDLEAYDEDGNGWIDENDDIFSKLKVWTKDAEGKDQLLSLKDADVGAIYLGRVGTEFTQKNIDGRADAIVRSTGVYLKESSGSVGTVAHVDLVL